VIVRYADDRDGTYQHNEFLKHALAAFAAAADAGAAHAAAADAGDEVKP
jgi:hypothetical protein